MAEKKTAAQLAAEKEAAKMAAGEERVDIFVPKDGNDSPLIIGINGVMYNLAKGKTNNVPWYVADALKRQAEAQDRYDETTEEMRKAAAAAV